MTPRISVVMIVKNEVDRLEAGLQSFASLGHLLHEVCIYDTGSTDGTIELARSYGARVEEGYWDDDFARARNCAAAMATGDWLFVVDADEQVHCDPTALSTLLTAAHPQPDGFFVTAHVDSRQDVSDHTWASVRLYQSTELEYHRPVHTELRRRDLLEPTLESLPESAVSLLNGGFDAARFSRSLALKDRLASLVIHGDGSDLARAHAYTDRGRARLGTSDIADAISDFVQAEALSQQSYTSYRAWNLEFLIRAYITAGMPEEAESALYVLEQVWPKRGYNRWLLGLVRAAQNRHLEALDAWGTISEAVDAGFVPLDGAELYKTALLSAIHAESQDATLACLCALVALPDERPRFASILAELWGNLNTLAACRAINLISTTPWEATLRELLDTPTTSAFARQLQATLSGSTYTRGTHVSHDEIPSL